MAVYQAPPPHYRALSLRLPAAATSAQRSRGQRGVSIDLILDCAQNGGRERAGLAYCRCASCSWGEHLGRMSFIMSWMGSDYEVLFKRTTGSLS